MGACEGFRQEVAQQMELSGRRFDSGHVHNIDCIEGMRSFPDKYFELAIIDPPYGIGEDGSKNHTRGNKGIAAKDYKPFAGGDKEAPGLEYFRELFRVSRNQIIWGANHFISRIPYDSSCWIVWDKHRENQDFADCELAWTSFKSSVKKFSFAWDGFRQGNMKHKEIRIHPTQKPVALYAWLLRNYAREGDKILDTHVGSGSSRIAAWEMGYDYTGFEIDRHYYKAQERRFREHTSQLRII